MDRAKEHAELEAQIKDFQIRYNDEITCNPLVRQIQRLAKQLTGALNEAANQKIWFHLGTSNGPVFFGNDDTLSAEPMMFNFSLQSLSNA